MRTLKLTLAYDGADFAGWQRQTGAETIQALVETALQPLEGRAVTVHGAGRTDAGVHALGQVASVRLTHPIGADALLRALNANLPAAVRVLQVEEAADRFHARFDARGKVYRYRLATAPVAHPLDLRYAWHLPQPLDLGAMQAAGALLEGRHDFAAFQAAGGAATASTVRSISLLRIALERPPDWRGASGGGGIIGIEVRGDGFLRHMVRVIVGTLVEVGRGRCAAGSVADVLATRDRASAGPTAPARGLFLVRVDYQPVAKAPRRTETGEAPV